MRRLLLLSILILCCSSVSAKELRLMSDTSESWHARETPGVPATEREIIALQAATAKAVVTQDALSAYYLGQRNSYDLVTVEEAPDTPGGARAICSYLLRDGKIWDETRIKYVVKPNPESEQVAREIAKDYLLGRISPVPVIFNGWVYSVNSDGKCLVTVIAKNENEVDFTYRYNSCR